MQESSVEPLTSATVAVVKISGACQQALANPSKDNLRKLNDILESVSLASVKENQTRILLILLQLISKEIGFEIKLRATSCLECVLKKVPVVSDFFILRSILQQLIQLLFDPQESKLAVDVPEELHLKSLQIMCNLLKNTTSAQQEKLYSVNAAPFLGVLVCLCLAEAETQQFKKIKFAAIECLMACGQVLEKPPDDSDLHTKTAKIFMNFVPGVVKGLQQVICADEKQGYAVTLVAVRAWGRMITQVMDNPATVIEGEKDSHKSLSSASNLAEMQQLMENNQRNLAFFKMADQWLRCNVEAVCSVQSHLHPKVRLELVLSAKLILVRCSRNLPSCVVPLLEVLVALSEDEVSEVSKEASTALEEVSAIFDEDSSLVEILEANLFRVADTLPQAFSKKDEMNQITSLSLLVGYFRLLGPQLGEALLLHCQVVLNSLIFVSTFESSHVVLLEDVALRAEPTGFENRYWRQHKYYSSLNVENLLRKGCRLLCQQSHIVIPQLLTEIIDKPITRKETVNLINLILENEVEFSLAKVVIQNYLDPAIWDLAIDIDRDATPAEARSNCVLAALLCEGLAAITASAGEKAPSLLGLVLYPILERAGSTNEVVALSGQLALTSLAKNLGYESSASLICREAHYFTHHVAVRLRRLKDNPGALLVLCAVLKHGSQEILPSIELIIKDVLQRSQDARCLPNYIDVFLALISNISQWQSERMDVDVPATKKFKKTQISHRSMVIEELILLNKINISSFSDSDDAIDEDELPQQPEDQHMEDNEAPPPIHVQLAEIVMLRCLHMLPSKDKDIQIMALRILKKGLPIIAPFENQLLPFVHKLWSPMVQRFSPSQDVVVLRLSFELLCVTASTSKSFIRRRCLEQVLPSICQFIEKQANVTQKQRGMHYSQTFKLQATALNHLGPLASDLELQEEDIHLILKSCSPYLNSEQPQALQESCVNLFEFMKNVNSDAVWLRLNSLWNTGQEMQAPTKLLANVRMPLLPSDSAMYKKNVEVLLLNM